MAFFAAQERFLTFGPDRMRQSGLYGGVEWENSRDKRLTPRKPLLPIRLEAIAKVSSAKAANDSVGSYSEGYD